MVKVNMGNLHGVRAVAEAGSDKLNLLKAADALCSSDAFFLVTKRGITMRVIANHSEKELLAPCEAALPVLNHEIQRIKNKKGK